MKELMSWGSQKLRPLKRRNTGSFVNKISEQFWNILGPPLLYGNKFRYGHTWSRDSIDIVDPIPTSEEYLLHIGTQWSRIHIDTIHKQQNQIRKGVKTM